MTFSLVARRAETRMLGMAISSSSSAVAARCAYARAAVGAAVAGAAHVQCRQLLAVDAMGRTSIHSGSNVFGNWNEAQGVDVASGGNLLDNDGVSKAIVAG